MSAVLDSNATGYKVGSTKGNTWFITALSLALVGYNAIHLHDYAVVNFINEDTGIIKEYAIRLAATGVAFLEIVIGGVFVYLYRTSESKFNAPLLLVGFLALVVASMAVVAGNGSQQSKADVKSNKVNAHDSSLTVIDNKMKSAEIQRDIDLRLANQIKNANQRAIEKDRANLNYSNKVTRLNSQKSVKQSSRPVQPFANDSIGHYISITLFSILCSFGALFLSGYSAAFLKPLVAIPAITFVEKLKHAWSSSAKDFQTTQHQISPVGGFIGNLVRLRKVTPKPNERTSTVNDTVNRPAPHDSLLSSNSDSTPEQSARAPEQPSEKGLQVDYDASHYAEIKQGILNQSIAPTTRPIKAELNSLMVKFVNDAEREKKAAQILIQLKGEGVIIDNPNAGKGKAKYVLNGDYQSDETEEEGEDKMISSICPECKHQSKVSESNLEKWNGLCGCPECSSDYVVMDNLAERKSS